MRMDGLRDGTIQAFTRRFNPYISKPYNLARYNRSPNEPSRLKRR
jgi:hypothetical protein